MNVVKLFGSPYMQASTLSYNQSQLHVKPIGMARSSG